MGRVVKAFDRVLHRVVAIKVLVEEHRNDPEIIRRFFKEAKIGCQLQHPGIVPVYDLGTDAGGRPYFAMKLVQGRTLASLLQDHQDRVHDQPRFLAIFEAVCQVLAYAHARGVIHRDLKPANIMVGAFGEVQVVDWGLAKVRRTEGVADEPKGRTEPEPSSIRAQGSSSDVDLSKVGTVLGTPAYMSPEQAGGQVEVIDERADVFGLGSILCEILTGSPAYIGCSSDEILGKAACATLSEAHARLDACDAVADLISLARDCLAVEPERRPSDAVEVSRRMSAYQAGVQERFQVAELVRVEPQARVEEAPARSRIERSRRQRTVALAAPVLGWASARLLAEVLERGVHTSSRLPFSSAAAFSTAPAGTGKEDDDPPPDDTAKSRLRKQALVWVRTDLADDARPALPKSDSQEFRALGAEVDRLTKAMGGRTGPPYEVEANERLYRARERPTLAEDFTAGQRYLAACCAALATKRSVDEPLLQDDNRARWRGQAHDGPQADLEPWQPRARSPIDRVCNPAARILRFWAADPDLVSLRDAAILAALPEADRQAFRALWADLDRLIEAAEGRTVPSE